MDVLKFIAENASEKLYFIAKEHNVTLLELQNLAIKLLHLPSREILTDTEIYIYKVILSPLIQKQFCEGAYAFMTNKESCAGRIFVDQENIFVCYMNEQCMCKVK